MDYLGSLLEALRVLLRVYIPVYILIYLFVCYSVLKIREFSIGILLPSWDSYDYGDKRKIAKCFHWFSWIYLVIGVIIAMSCYMLNFIVESNPEQPKYVENIQTLEELRDDQVYYYKYSQRLCTLEMQDGCADVLLREDGNLHIFVIRRQSTPRGEHYSIEYEHGYYLNWTILYMEREYQRSGEICWFDVGEIENSQNEDAYLWTVLPYGQEMPDIYHSSFGFVFDGEMYMLYIKEQPKKELATTESTVCIGGEPDA